jgi:ADP-heptose:LPS heptosyltransferase
MRQMQPNSAGDGKRPAQHGPNSFLEAAAWLVQEGGRVHTDIPVPAAFYPQPGEEISSYSANVLERYGLERQNYAVVILQPEGDYLNGAGKPWQDQPRWPAQNFGALHGQLEGEVDRVVYIMADEQDARFLAGQQEGCTAYVTQKSEVLGLDMKDGNPEQKLGDYLAICQHAALTVGANNDLMALATVMEGPVVVLGDEHWSPEQFRPKRSHGAFRVIKGNVDNIPYSAVEAAVRDALVPPQPEGGAPDFGFDK